MDAFSTVLLTLSIMLLAGCIVWMWARQAVSDVLNADSAFDTRPVDNWVLPGYNHRGNM